MVLTAFPVGFLAGLFGIGGGLITVPFLFFIFNSFNINQDYLMYVDGKPRIEGIKSFLSSREIYLENGNEDSDKSHTTVWGLGKIKDNIFRELIVSEGVSVYESTIDLVNIFSDLELHVGQILNAGL